MLVGGTALGLVALMGPGHPHLEEALAGTLPPSEIFEIDVGCIAYKLVLDMVEHAGFGSVIGPQTEGVVCYAQQISRGTDSES